MDVKMRFEQAIRDRLEQLGMKPFAAEQAYNLPPDTLRNILNPRNKNGAGPKLAKISEVCEALGIEISFGPPRSVEPTTELDGERFATIARYEASAAAGHGVVNLDAPPKDHLAVPRDWLIETGIRPDRCILITARGDSMAPAISNGDLVMIDRHRTEITSGKLYVYNAPEDGTRVKRLELLPGTAIIARSDNPDQKRYPPEYHTGPAMNAISQNILGEVVWSGHLWR
ncbi:S24/S26 family peptidase [Mameliella sp. MMSF_3455]|uniref:S24 family peptidase n=1 Tax=Mameliella sp. MMSF_3455 TaxID=3046714 RepID=UPI00273D97AA|nr:S24/S26 family peptidase [Mameliella sp. MMSF_3455]